MIMLVHIVRLPGPLNVNHLFRYLAESEHGDHRYFIKSFETGLDAVFTISRNNSHYSHFGIVLIVCVRYLPFSVNYISIPYSIGIVIR